MMGNMHPGAFVVDHGSVQQQQWSPRMPNPMSQNQMYTSHQGYPGNQPMRPTAIHSIHQSAHVRPQIVHGIRPDRGMEVIDLTKEPQISKPDMQRHIPGNQHISGGNEPPSGPKDETESTVQRELTAALARRQGTGFDQQPQPQPQPQQMVRRDNIPNIAHYGPKPYPVHNPVSPQGVPQGQHSSSLYPHQGHAHAGNPMSSLTDAPYASMQNRQSTAGAQYRMQEPTSVKSALLSSGPKPMMSAPNYAMNTSTQAPSYATPQYQQRTTEKASQMVESYQRMPEKGSIMPGQVPHQQPQSSYADHLNRGGPAMTNQYKPPQQPVAWRPQVPTSVSNVPMSIEKQQHMMMMARKSQWQHYSQAQKYPMSQKGANPAMSSSGPSHAMQAGVPPLSQSGGSNYAMAPSSQNQEHSMHMRAALHNMRMMQRGPAPGSGPVPGPMQAKMQQTMQQGYPRESGMLAPGQGAAPALIEFQEQDNQRRMQQVAMTQPPPRLHQFNGSCVVCGSLAMYLCSSCRMVWYCSQTCQNNHWKRHGPECKPIKAGLPGQL
ncbi:uncharacterized protein LOC124268541 [Haliotis rubra]|uniref:uncharacterized protein LOC124268541 n=1 Tax=Haliotis rubra TaxID=36100 RepID=UPI001EE62A69|nr:uncharacterized protein LOC124268541 [Haliotis rubra]